MTLKFGELARKFCLAQGFSLTSAFIAGYGAGSRKRKELSPWGTFTIILSIMSVMWMVYIGTQTMDLSLVASQLGIGSSVGARKDAPNTALDCKASLNEIYKGFQHFSDTAELYVAVLGRVLIALTGDMPEAALGMPLDRRIDAVAEVFAARFESVLPMWPFLQALQQRSGEAAGLIVGTYAASRTRLGQWFLQELTSLSATARERTLNALCLSLAPEGWVVLRQRLALGVDDARDEWRFMLKAMLNGDATKR